MKHLRVGIAAAGVFLLAGCAVAPDDIPPQYVSSVPYDSWTCPQLGEEQMRVSTALATASATQDSARTDDTVGVLLIGLPIASMSGEDDAPQIGLLKGERVAVQQAEIRNDCR